ncbi:MAG TPA: M14 family metallopeptidase, partial [Burkholderiaceae bacterium]
MSHAPLPTPSFDRFPRHEELGALLRAYADARPDLVAVRSIGRSHEGREIWVATLTNTATGDDVDKPALWVDGNIHAAELTACTAALYYLHQLASSHGTDARVTHLLDTRAVYLCPRLNPDGAELALAERPRHIRSSTRPYPFDEDHVDGMVLEDVDGDGRILYMRVPDPHGTYKKHPCEPRLMVAREPGEVGGEYFRVMPEGTIKDWDGLRLRLNRDREGLDLNRNFPSQWRQEFEQVGAGPYPANEPEVRAMVDFCVAHPNIGAGISFHTHSGVILRPMGTTSDDDMVPEDLWMIKRLSEIGSKLTGYPALSVFHDFKYHPKEVVTGTQDWLYEHLGALCWTVEIWAPNREAGIEKYDYIHWYRDHPPEDDLKLLKWSDEQCGGQAHVDWRPFVHPQLGPVEIGGWDRMNYWRNPPPHLREREAARFPAWLTTLGLALPKLEVLQASCEPLGHDGQGDTWRLRLAVGNAGYLPAYVSQRAKTRKVVRGTVFEIALPAGATLVTGKARELGEHLEGHAPRGTLQAFLPDRAITADRTLQEWIVRGP